MKKLVPAKCPNCGANLKLDDNMKKAECKYCQATIIVDEAIENYKIDVSGSKVKIDKSDTLGNYYKMAESAYESDNKKEAEDYCNKIIEEDINNYKAWFLKGKAAGWQSTLRNLRIDETVNCFTKAIENAPEKEVEKIKQDASKEIKELSLAVIRLSCNNYAKYPDKDNAGEIYQYVVEILRYSLKLMQQCDVSAEDFKNDVAAIITQAVVEAWKKIEKDYDENNHPSEYTWDEYRKRLIAEISLQEYAINYSDKDDASDIQRYKNLIFFAKKLIDSCSWTYMNGMYVKEYTLTDAAIEDKLNQIMDWNNKIKALDPNYVIPDISTYRPPKPAQNSGCYVATCVYGSYDCPEVWTLRRYRDYKLAKTLHGRLFIKTYYAISPTIVKLFGKTNLFKNIWKPKLDKMVSKLQKEGYDSTPYKDIEW